MNIFRFEYTQERLWKHIQLQGVMSKLLLSSLAPVENMCPQWPAWFSQLKKESAWSLTQQQHSTEIQAVCSRVRQLKLNFSHLPLTSQVVLDKLLHFPLPLPAPRLHNGVNIAYLKVIVRVRRFNNQQPLVQQVS